WREKDPKFVDPDTKELCHAKVPELVHQDEPDQQCDKNKYGHELAGYLLFFSELNQAYATVGRKLGERNPHSPLVHADREPEVCLHDSFFYLFAERAV